jgi:pseudomonalisin
LPHDPAAALHSSPEILTIKLFLAFSGMWIPPAEIPLPSAITGDAVTCLPGRAMVACLSPAARRFCRLGLLRSLVLTLLLLLLGGAAPLLGATPDRIKGPVDAAQMMPLPDHHPLWAVPANDAGPVSMDMRLNQLTLVLARSAERQAAFDRLLADQQNPASPEFHHWLTPAQIGQRFGLSDHDIETLDAWLESEGLRVTWVAPSRTFIGFAGTAAVVGRAFQTELHNYRVNGELRLSVAADPKIPRALAPVVQAVSGLYSIADRPSHLARAAQAGAPELSIGSNGFVAPQDFATIYDLPSNLSGAGTTIGIVGWSRVDLADLDAFRQRTGTSFPDPVEVVPNAYGGIDPGAAYTSQPDCSGCLGGQEEATLDVQRAGSVAQGANLLLVVSSSSGANDGIGADAQYLIQSSPAPAQIVDISFGDCESDAGSAGVSYWNNLFEQAAAEGISVIVSSGDSGAAGCDNSFTAPPSSPSAVSPNYICSSQYATCVGGTDFNDAGNRNQYWNSNNGEALGSALSYIPEAAWNEPLDADSQPQAASSGGGVSRYVATPAWQEGVAGVPTGNAGRYTPDVSFSSSCREGYFGCMAAGGGSCISGGTGAYTFEIFCGTSAAAPGMAGIAALMDEKMGVPQGNFNPQLYAMPASAPSALHDVTIVSSGVTDCSLSTPSTCNNSVPSATNLTGGQAGYLVGPGFDEVTGLGSLDVQKFLMSYRPGSNSASFTEPPVTGFSISGVPLTLAPGADSNNASTITITPASGFNGTVTLSAQITSAPTGAQNLPALSWSSSNQINITGAGAVHVSLSVTTASPRAAALASPAGSSWPPAAASVLACLLLFGIPGRRRTWRNLLGIVALLAALTLSTTGCSAGIRGNILSASSGTTPGNYIITVTGSSGSLVTSGTIPLYVQ